MPGKQVFKGTAADKSGFKIGDVIVSVDGKRVGNRKDLLLRVTDTSPGTDIRIRILRDGSARELKVTLGERPTLRPAPR